MLAAAVAASAALTLAPAALADPAPFTDVELNQPADQSVALEARFNLSNDAEVGMRELRAIRARMWDENPRYVVGNTTGSLRDVATAAGLNSKEAYVNAIVLDQGYSRISLQRAVEAAKLFKHERQYNDTCAGNCGMPFTATINGRGGSGENLSSSSDIAAAMKGWGESEVRALRATNGEFSAERATMNGHLHSFLNPWNTRVGFASVVTAEGTASASVMGRQATGVNSFPEGNRKEALARPAAKGETPSATPKKLSVLKSGGSSLEEIQAIAGIITAVVSLITVLATVGHQMGFF